MTEKTWKRIWIVVAVLIVTVAIFIGKYIHDSSKNTLSGEQWLKAQEMYMTEFEFFADDIDTVLTLYLTGSINEENFLNHMTVFHEQLYYMQTQYMEDKKNYPVQTGSHTYDTKRGSEAVEKCYGTFKQLINMMEANYEDKEALSYKYLAYQEEFLNHASDYMTAKELVFGGKKDE